MVVAKVVGESRRRDHHQRREVEQHGAVVMGEANGAKLGIFDKRVDVSNGFVDFGRITAEQTDRGFWLRERNVARKTRRVMFINILGRLMKGDRAARQSMTRGMRIYAVQTAGRTLRRCA